jgi:hypothetical protein
MLIVDNHKSGFEKSLQKYGFSLKSPNILPIMRNFLPKVCLCRDFFVTLYLENQQLFE